MRSQGGAGLLNFGWSLLLFKLQRPDLSMIEIGFLWLSILGLVVWVAALSWRASALLVPYLLWVGYASTVNWGIIRLNPAG